MKIALDLQKLREANVASKWKLSADELAEVMRTGHVWLHAWGITHPPIAVSGANPFKE